MSDKPVDKMTLDEKMEYVRRGGRLAGKTNNLLYRIWDSIYAGNFPPLTEISEEYLEKEKEGK